MWIVDIESNWNFSHTDLNASLIGPASALVAQSNIDHGTAVLGILGGRNDGIGVTGIAYNSTIFTAARTTAAGYDPAAAIVRATAALRPGDVILCEMQTDGPAAGGNDLVPIEWESASYNAIQTAVGNGMIVVEAAGNGSQNLDDPIFNTGHSPFLANHDSGAIIVGAGGSPTGAAGDRSRLGFSSFGSTVDLQGWGENVVTTGYGDLYSADGMNKPLHRDLQRHLQRHAHRGRGVRLASGPSQDHQLRRGADSAGNAGNLARDWFAPDERHRDTGRNLLPVWHDGDPANGIPRL